MTENLNKIKTWAQGYFVDQPQYSHETNGWKVKRDSEEHHLVRPGPTDNAICQCSDPEDAEWIAGRLNFASEMDAVLEAIQANTQSNLEQTNQEWLRLYAFKETLDALKK